ncbi:MAG: hypothetical protein JKX71_04065 [Amylibacter sp.]|nr:hypothetical protein [Amylibacter sp.]
MTTYTIPGFRIIFDNATDTATSFTPNVDFNITTPDGLGFSYTYDPIPPGPDPITTGITIDSSDYSATVGGANIPLSSATSAEAIVLQWGPAVLLIFYCLSLI